MEHAILIPGLLRCIDENLIDFLDSSSGHAKIFILTERCCEQAAMLLAYKYNATCVFMEDIEINLNTNNFPGALQQFLKLELSLDQLATWEAKEKQQFKFIHRFRTDLIYESSFLEYISPLLTSKTPHNYLLNQHDMNFSGERENFLKLKGISSYIRKFHKRKRFFYKQITKIKKDALIQSEPEFSIFAGALPVGVAKSESAINEFHDSIQEDYPNYIEASLAFASKIKVLGASSGEVKILYSNSILARTYTGKYSPFFPENIYARYLNKQGLSTRQYTNPWLSLKHSRHAATEQSKRFLDLIQRQDYSFFEEGIDWKGILDDFKSAGGSIGKLIYIFALINPYKLTDIQCKDFYKVIDMLDEANYIRIHHVGFIRNVKHRGLEPPSCLKEWIDA